MASPKSLDGAASTPAVVPHVRDLLSPPPTDTSLRLAKPKKRALTQLAPNDYARAVLDYSRLPTGAGQNHKNLGDYLSKPFAIQIDSHAALQDDPFVTLHELETQGPPIIAQDADSGDDRSHDGCKPKRWREFADPVAFANFGKDSGGEDRSRLVFLRGFMSATWINTIGARYLVDPEFFCRHLDFKPADDIDNMFSSPPLPSASWHLIQLPIMTVGARNTNTGLICLEDLEKLRCDGRKKLIAHHKAINRLARSGMSLGESMVRDYHVFDETHFAFEQRISICLKENDDNDGFNLFVWLDGGKDFAKDTNEFPWSQKKGDHFLPIIRHKNMIALKSHLFGQDAIGAKHASSASLLHRDYGRSLRPSVMCTDALYALNEVFSFSASSEIAFLNIIEHKLDKYTEPSEDEFEMLPNLRYTKAILYRHIQKIDQILTSIHNTKHPRWPKTKCAEGTKKAEVASGGLVQDFQHLKDRAHTLHNRCNEAITVLMSSMSIAESRKAINQAERVTKLTFLAFIFVPLSFTTSFFGMNVKQFGTETSLWWWAAFTVPVFGFAFTAFFLDWARPFRALLRLVKRIYDKV
ncbi:CorA/Zinc transport protein ZntB [Pyrenophora tritici-repentis]|nr:CorA/Zinc transport protein ZntB [Pyrenophora tritici-repentis]